MRYLPLDDRDRAQMLAAIGVGDIDALFADLPEAARNPAIDLPGHQSEIAVAADLQALSRRNLAAGDAAFFLGAGAYRHHIPASVDHITQRGEFLTSYTPYQPEIAQGTLQTMFEFQTQVARLTGMDIANASLYDGSTACLEAVLMAKRITKRAKTLVSGGLHGHYADVLASMTEGCVVADPVPGDDSETLIPDVDCAAVVVQYPNQFGEIADLRPLAERAHQAGALLIVVVTEPVALGLLRSPGALGADIVCGEGQALGVGLQFGGPYLGLMATRSEYLRQMPGRLVGETVDQAGKRSFVLTLSAREQHIRREKATSNICTNSGLCALAFSAHLSLLGGAGLRKLAMINHRRAVTLAGRLDGVAGVKVLNHAFFNEFCVLLSEAAAPVAAKLADRKILAGVPLSRLYPDRPALARHLLIAVSELTRDDEIEALVDGLHEVLA